MLDMKHTLSSVMHLSLRWWSTGHHVCKSLLFTSGFSSTLSRNRAIADYLRSNGYEEAYSTFKKEAVLDMVRKE